MKVFLVLSLASLLVLSLSAVVAWGPAYYTGTHTDQCPFDHKVDDDSQCVVLDREPMRTLIQHANTGTGERYFEIVSVGGISELYEIPAAAKGLAPEGYTANLLDGETEWLAINSRWEPLEPRP